MAWKYLNPGDYRLLNNYPSSNIANYTDKAISPVTGRAFGMEFTGNNYPIYIPDGIKEIWVVFTTFSSALNNNTSYFPRISLFGASTLSNSQSFEIYVGAKWVFIYRNNSRVVSYTFPSGASFLTRVWLHIKSGSSAGSAEVYLNNQQVYSISNFNIMKGEDIKCAQLSSRYTEYALSDIIFSDDPIDLDEHVAVLPIANTSAEGWTYDAVKNIYTADSAGKTIWQVPDINQLKAVTGLDNPSVTAVAVQAYNVSTNDTSQVDTLQKAVKQNGQTVITDSADISSATAVISSAMTVNPVTNAAWTLNDLANLQLGITTAKSA